MLDGFLIGRSFRTITSVTGDSRSHLKGPDCLFSHITDMSAEHAAACRELRD